MKHQSIASQSNSGVHEPILHVRSITFCIENASEELRIEPYLLVDVHLLCTHYDASSYTLEIWL